MTIDHTAPRWVFAVAPDSTVVEAISDALPLGRIFYLDARFENSGVWAGIEQLVELAFLELLDRGLHDTLEVHNYELYMALPKHRDKIKLKYGSLTDTSSGNERTRSFPLDRAYRIIHGLVGLILEWREIHAESDRWTIVVRRFDDAQHLGSRFFVELTRRVTLLHSDIDVILETQVDVRQLGLTGKTAPGWIDRLELEPLLEFDLDKAEKNRLGVELSSSRNVEFFEKHYPELLNQYRKDNDNLAAAKIASGAMSIYSFFGYYHEAVALMNIALPYFDMIVGDNEDQRWIYVIRSYTSLISIGEPEKAMAIIEELGMRHFTKLELRAQSNYMLSMGYLRFLKSPDLNLAEKYIFAAMADINAAKGEIDIGEFYFHKVFIDNGLAFLRVRQGRVSEALELCEAGFKLLTSKLGDDKHKLHRSVLLYNAAQVYAMLDQLGTAIEYYKRSISMDPYYSEYHNEAGNILQRMGSYQEALSFYDQAIECSAPYPEVYFNKAVCHARLDEYNEALENLEASLELDPYQSDGYMLHAEILDTMGREEDALANYDKAILLNEFSIEARVNRAVINFNQGKFDLALSDMNRVITIDTKQSSHYENRAEIYKAMNQDDLYRLDLEYAEVHRVSS